MKQLVSIGIVFLLVCIGLSGCTNTFNNDNTPSDNYQQEKKIQEPIFNVNNDYKSTCLSINISDLYSESNNYAGKNITCRGRIEDISYDEGYTIYEITDKDFLSGFMYTIYRYSMIPTNKYTNFQKNDLIQVWGVVQGRYSPDFSIYYYIYIWPFFIEKLYEKPNLSENAIQKFYQQVGWRNPTYAEMINFLNTDQTEYIQYNYTYQYADLLIEKARFKGYITGEVSIHSHNESYTGIGTIAEIVCFNTSDRGVLYVEAQTDEVFTQKDIDTMQSNGMYDSMQFDHYTINFLWGGGSFGSIDYSWDYSIGAWYFTFNNKEYVIYQNTNN